MQVHAIIIVLGAFCIRGRKNSMPAVTWENFLFNGRSWPFVQVEYARMKCAPAHPATAPHAFAHIKIGLPFVKRLKRNKSGVYSPIIIMIGYRFAVWRVFLKDQNLVRPITRRCSARRLFRNLFLPSSRYRRLIFVVHSYNFGKFI